MGQLFGNIVFYIVRNTTIDFITTDIVPLKTGSLCPMLTVSKRKCTNLGSMSVLKQVVELIIHCSYVWLIDLVYIFCFYFVNASC